ncbi:hypothetical protein GCM10007904_30340 [Oharaeibacter diazotrophicus]|nr:hypothetical protein GCM10007904_30340 [Oharaeibacter diazotrophicus]
MARVRRFGVVAEWPGPRPPPAGGTARTWTEGASYRQRERTPAAHMHVSSIHVSMLSNVREIVTAVSDEAD